MYSSHNGNLLKTRKDNGPLIAAHRGTPGGSVIQNTTLSYTNALLNGADLIEIDAVESTDGVFYAIHNGEEKTLLHMDGDIRKLSSKEIDTYDCYNSLQIRMEHQKLEKLADILPCFKDRCFINIDRSWFYWLNAIRFLSSMHMEDQIILKSPVREDLLNTLEQSKSDIMYMPIINTMEEWRLVRDRNINIVALEIIFETADSPLVSPQFMEEIHMKKLLAWGNAITLCDSRTLTARYDDNTSIRNGLDAGWGKLLSLGFDILQTDWPSLMKQYLTRKKYQ